LVIGGDFSHHNTEIPQGLGFILLKATEGKNWVDPCLVTHIEQVARLYAENLPVMGFYHFARPDNNEPEVEANFFLETIKPHIGKCLMALDWEEEDFLKKNSEVQVQWINDFSNAIFKKTGVYPFLYSSRFYMLKIFRSNIKLNPEIPIWLADYNGKRILNLNGKGIDMQQISSDIFDIDVFNGSKDYLVSFALPRK